MALPENKISKVKLPNNTEYDIVPKVLQDGTTNFSATLPTLTEDSTIALEGQVITKVEDIEDIPDNELGLYRFTEEVSGVTQSSHVYEVVKEDHGAEEREFYKTTTTNGTQLNNSTAFMSHFDSTLSNFISISSLGNVYCFYYDNDVVSRNGIRIGTKNTGSMSLTCTEDGSITFGKYFSYNGSTQVVTYDSGSAVIVDGTKYEFTGSDEDTITIDITAGEHTITSNGQDITGGSQTGRIILISFEFEGEPYSIYSPKALARVEEVQAVDADLQSYKTTVHNRFVTDEANIEVNRQGIADINSRMGDIQVFQAGNRLPNPSQQYLNKVYRLDGKFYQCVQKGDGVLKEITFDTVTGTSEVTTSNVSGFITDLDREDFSEYYYLDDSGNGWTKLFRNNGDIRLGSSSATGMIKFLLQSHYIDDLPVTKLKVGVKAYNQNGSDVNFELSGNISYVTDYEQFIDNADTETLIDLTEYLEESDPLYALRIETRDHHLIDEETINNDKRLIVTRLIAEFGTVEYEWQEISGGSSIESLITPITYAELKELRDNKQLIPGMQYRITDYSCTTTQFDTRSAGHNFDIIVTADSTHTLNENARACVKDDDNYFRKVSGFDWINPRPTPVFSYWLNTNEDTEYGKIPPAEQGPVHGTAQIITEYTKINYNGRELPAMFNPDPETTTFTNSVVSVQYVVRDDEYSYKGSTEYKPNDVFCELSYVEVDNTTYPVLYKNDIRYFGYNNVDHDDVFRYDGDYTLDGTVYSRWKKYQDSNFNTYSGIDILTQRIVVNNEFTITQEQLTAGITVSHESSENDLYYVYDGTETIMEGVENTLCHALYAVNEDGEEVYADGSYKVEDTFVEISYMTLDGVSTPVMYKNDLWDKAYVEEGTDYGDVFVYIGNLTVDGTTYNRWRKYEHGNIDPSDYTGFDVLTEVIVVNNQFTISQQEFTDAIQYNYVTYDKWKCLHASDLSPENGWYLTNKLVDNVYTESNLNTWELKYSLDNDTKRFGWALDGQQIVYNNVIYDRSSDNDNTNDNPDFTGYQIGWKSNDSSHNILYSPSETISSDDGLFNPAEEAVIFQPDYSVHTGKGVIYYMKDENNNECSYDFKNILFKRYQIESSNSFNSSYSGINSSQFPSDVGTINSFSLYAYTFTWLTEDNEEVIDASVAYNELPDDDNAFPGVHNNIIKSYNNSYGPYLELNNIVFLCRYSFKDGPFYGINNNSFEPDCKDCSFLDSCDNNNFGKKCYQLFFASYCDYNIIQSNSFRIVLYGTVTNNTLSGNDITIGSSSYNNNISGGFIQCGKMFRRVNINYSSHINFILNGYPLDSVEDVIIDSGCDYLEISSTTAYETQYLPVAKMHIHTGVHGTSSSSKIIIKGRSSGGLEQEYLYNYYASGTKDIILD